MIAAVLRELMAAGLTGEALCDAVERIEAQIEPSAPVRSARQARNARYYEARKGRASEKRLKASEASETSYSDQKVSPKPPSKNTPSSAPKGASSPPLTDSVADSLWQIANPASRNRSGRPQTRRAVSAALTKGATVSALEASVRDHCRKSGEHAKGLHRIIEGELWRDCTAKTKAHPPPVDPAYLASRVAHFHATGEWRSEWGERPRRAA